MKHHVLITGTGRAGTSFLVQLLSNLGLDTGYTPGEFPLDPIAHAGLEADPRDPAAPYICKNPWICDTIEEVLTDSALHIDHVFIPVRNIEAAAASRVHVQKANTGSEDMLQPVAGGLWHVEKGADQAALLRRQFTRLVEQLVRFDIGMTFIWYPRLTEDPDYLRAKLAQGLDMPDPDVFREVFARTVRPEWVHRFGAEDSTGAR